MIISTKDMEQLVVIVSIKVMELIIKYVAGGDYNYKGYGAGGDCQYKGYGAGGDYSYKGYGAGGDYLTQVMELVVVMNVHNHIMTETKKEDGLSKTKKIQN